MEIKTKFNVGDIVLAILNGSFAKVVIESIHIHTRGNDNVELSYEVISETMSSTYSIDEKRLFKNKEELIKFISEKL